MTDGPTSKLAALITLHGPEHGPPDDSSPLLVLGKPVSYRQVEFALACNCGTIILFGHGASGEAIALRHLAEKGGARVQIVAGGHALANVVPADARLLVIQPGLLPGGMEDADLTALCSSGGVLILPAGAGVAAGFERIDLARAWAGLLVLPAELIDKLQQLPEDADPNAALLRISLQAKLAEISLTAEIVDEGAWVIAGRAGQWAEVEEKWLARHVPRARGWSPGGQLVRAIMERSGTSMLARPRLGLALTGGAIACMAGAVASAFYGLPIVAFILLMLAPPLAEMAGSLKIMGMAPYGSKVGTNPWRPLFDAALLASGILLLEGQWYERSLPPVLLLCAANITPQPRFAALFELLRDRSVICLALAASSALLPVAAGFFGISLLLLVSLVLLSTMQRS